MAKPSTIDEYLAALPEDRRAVMAQLRQTVTAAAPQAVETIAYDMPALRLDGRFFVSYAAYKNHYSLFPASDGVVAALGEDLAPYLSGRGTIRFPASAPLPTSLVRRIIEVRLKEHAAHGS